MGWIKITVEIISRRNRSGARPISDDQRNTINKAVADVIKMINEINKYMNYIWNQSGTPRQRRRKRKAVWVTQGAAPIAVTSPCGGVVKWFGSRNLTNNQIRLTRNRVKRIKNHLDGTMRFRIIHYCTGERSWKCRTFCIAYTSPLTPIKLCPKYFKESPKRKSTIIIHELVHMIGADRLHQGGVITRDQALDLALHHPRKARRNPENYAQYGGDIYDLLGL